MAKGKHTLYPGAYYVYYLPYQWLNDEDEAITLSDAKGNVVDKTQVLSDTKNDSRCWVRNDSQWVFEVREEFVKPTPEPSPSPTPFHTPTPINLSKLGESGIVIAVIDSDTIDVEDVGMIRFADINTPEIDTEEGKAAKEYVKGLCCQKKVYLDIDDIHIIDKYGRIIAVVYVPYNETHLVNLNQLLLKEGYAEAKDYPNEFYPDVWIESLLEYVAMIQTFEHTLIPTPSPSPIPTLPPTTIPGFEFVCAMTGVLAAIYLIRQGDKITFCR